MVNIRRGRARDLDIDVVLPTILVAWQAQRFRSQIDAADEGGLGWMAGVDQPRFLVVAVGCSCPVPSNADPRSPSR